MHYLVVAKVEDYPDVIELLKALTYNHPVEKDFWGKWEKIAGKLTANGFAHWFLENRESDMKIPYEEGNKLHKIIRLAEANNREFKTPIESKNG